jgi:hypothetical protein
MKNNNFITNILIILLFILLTIAGIISYKGIDWNVLKRMEDQKIILPTPIPQTPISTVSATSTPSSLQK